MKKNEAHIREILSSGPVQKFILENEHSDIRDIVLKNKTLFSIPAANLSEQIGARRKAKDKLPLYFNTPGILYPPAYNLEQCSSQVTAIYKSELIEQWLPNSYDAIGADLTGGFGVDAFFISRKVKQLHYIESETFLLGLVRHNHQLLGVKNIQYHSTRAEDFVRSNSVQPDFVFIDPSRRSAKGRKVHALSDAEPNIVGLQPGIFAITTRLMIKASPLLDIQAGNRELSNVKEVHVVSVNNECKELLILCEKGVTVEPSIHAVTLASDGSHQRFLFTFDEERRQKIPFGDPSSYLYEPNASILKAGAFKTVAGRFNLTKIAASTHLYTSETLINDFPGRRFEIEAFVKPEPALMNKYFPDGKANVTTRNYPISAEALKKKTRLMDGGEKFLLGFSGAHKKHLVVARRV